MKYFFTFFAFIIIFSLYGQEFTKLKTFDNISFGNSGYEPVAAFDNKIIFKVGNPSDPHQLFVSDGTEAGTKEVDAITQFDYFDRFVNDDAEYLYYVKEISGSDDILMKMNKSGFSKEEVGKDFIYRDLTLWNGKLYYLNGSDLRQLDPATKQVKTVKGSLVAQSSLMFSIYNDKLFILHKNYSDNKTVLTVSDGTGAGTVQVKDFGIDASAVARFEGPWFHGGKMYFTLYGRYSGTWDKSMWVSDGTDAGTVKLNQIHYHDNSTSATYGISGSKYFYFRASDPGNTNLQLFRTDGTVSGTIKIGADKVVTPISFVQYKGKTYFLGSDLNNKGNLYFANDDDVEVVYNFNNAGVDLLSTFIFNDSLFFVGNNNALGSEFWKSDGSANGLTAISQGNKAQNASIFQVTVSGKYIYYSKRVNGEEKELWLYDPKKYVASVRQEVETINVHPNPATGYIQLPDNIQTGCVEIIDLSGRVVLLQALRNNIIDISTMPAGTYMVKLVNSRKTYISKFIKI